MPTATALAGIRINDAHADAGERMADASSFCADLAKSGSAKIARVHGDDRRTFRGAVTFERTNAETVFERERQTLGQFFRADHHVLQAAEIFGEQRRI